MVNEEEIDTKINFIAKTTLGGLKGVFVENNLDDRQATLCLYKFIEIFVRWGWKNSKPIDVLNNLIDVIKSSDNRRKK